MKLKKKPKSVATILEREVAPTIKEWLRRVSLLPELTRIPLSDEDRSRHLPKLFHDLACRLRLTKDIRLLASSAALRTDKGGDFRATLRSCWSRSQGCFRWSRSRRYTFTKANSIKTNCFQRLWSLQTRRICSSGKPWAAGKRRSLSATLNSDASKRRSR